MSKPFALITLLACAVIACLHSVVVGGKIQDGSNIGALCRREKIDLGRLSKFDELVENLHKYDGDCPQRTTSAIKDLKAIIDLHRDDECSESSVRRFENFYQAYLYSYAKDSRSVKEKLPFSLRKFAIAYGVQLGLLCRLNMVQELLKAGDNYTQPEDFAALEEFIKPDGPVARAISYSSTRPDDMVLPTDFLALAGYDDGQYLHGTGYENSLKLYESPRVKYLQVLCELRFRPVYGPLLLPVSRLANLGFSDRKSLLKSTLDEAAANPETRDTIGRWTRAAFLCESLLRVELVPEPSVELTAELADDKTVASDLDETKKTPTDVSGADDEWEAVDLGTIKEVSFRPNLSIEIPDRIYGTFSLNRRTDHFNTGQTARAKIKMQMFARLLRNFEKDLAHFRLHKVFVGLMLQTWYSLRTLLSSRDNHGKYSKPSCVRADIASHLHELSRIKDMPVKMADLDKIATAIFVTGLVGCGLFLIIAGACSSPG